MNATRDDPRAMRAAELASALRVVVGRLSRRFREQGSAGDLTWSQKAVLRHLERETSATVSALARLEGVRPQSMGATVAELAAVGLVYDTPDPSDGRQTLWSLTAACRAQITAARAAREDWLLRAVCTRLAPDEQETLATAVALLERLVDPESPSSVASR